MGFVGVEFNSVIGSGEAVHLTNEPLADLASNINILMTIVFNIHIFCLSLIQFLEPVRIGNIQIRSLLDT